MKIWHFPTVEWDSIYSISEWREKPYKKEKVYSKIISLDTETSKENDEILYITDWSITIEDFGCIYGNTISDLITTINKILSILDASEKARVLFFVHNFSYDYMFLRNHLFKEFGTPEYSLATKPHKYVCMRFSNGLEFRDSYILCGRSLEKFAKDMGCEVKKQVGSWDYEKKRTPGSERTQEEINYVCADTIALVQALRIWMKQHKVNTATCEYTNTGFVRSEGLKASKSDKTWRYSFRKSALTLDQYTLLDNAFHGGYTHANRYHIGEIIHDVTSYDFTSSYPARMLYNKFPSGRFVDFTTTNVYDIIELADVYAFSGYLLLTDAVVNIDCPMPPIAKHKCKILRDAIIDNGRVVKASLLVVPFTDPDLETIMEYYTFSEAHVSNVIVTEKAYLPDWFCDLIMELFQNKTTLKGKDDVLYMLSKGMLNSLYGMSVQKIIRDEITEEFDQNAWIVRKTMQDAELANEKLLAFYKNRKKYLPFQWGVWVTAYAQQELFKLGKLCGNWIYSDTDSVKGTDWNINALEQYNKQILEQANARGYGSLDYNGKTYTIGTAEFDGFYSEFVTLGSKRYCYRENEKLHITVAGVPKIGVSELNDDIRNFRRNMIFKETNKKCASYIYHDGIKKIIIDGEEVEYGCSVRLDDVEYTLDQTLQYDKKTGLPLSEYLY